MKKLILLAFIISLVSCEIINNQQDPLRYKGCVIDCKRSVFNYHGFVLKLTDELRDSLGHDYYRIEVSKREYDLFDIGDTIK